MYLSIFCSNSFFWLHLKIKTLTTGDENDQNSSDKFAVARQQELFLAPKVNDL